MIFIIFLLLKACFTADLHRVGVRNISYVVEDHPVEGCIMYPSQSRVGLPFCLPWHWICPQSIRIPKTSLRLHSILRWVPKVFPIAGLSTINNGSLIDKDHEQLPLVIYLHGWPSFCLENPDFLMSLAASGYVVAAMNINGISLQNDYEEEWFEDAEKYVHPFVELLRNHVCRGEGCFEFLEGRVNTENVFVIGNSYGGFITFYANQHWVGGRGYICSGEPFQTKMEERKVSACFQIFGNPDHDHVAPTDFKKNFENRFAASLWVWQVQKCAHSTITLIGKFAKYKWFHWILKKLGFEDDIKDGLEPYDYDHSRQVLLALALRALNKTFQRHVTTGTVIPLDHRDKFDSRNN